MTVEIKEDERPVVWFDIDNTLYSASAKISHAMGERIHNYFVGLGLSHEEAHELHLKYYSQYGLALRGLTRHHKIDPLDFDRKCDGSLPLEEMIKYDPKVRKLFEDIDKSKVRIWGLTNAYKNHAQRVLRILKIDDLFDGLVFCDYEMEDFVCKPEPEFYTMAMKVANIRDPSKCYFVDDSRSNVEGAIAQQWGHVVHFCEQGLEMVEGGVKRQISTRKDGHTEEDGVQYVTNLDGLRELWPEIFKQ